jgi:uncharacterized protein with NRDE domain
MCLVLLALGTSAEFPFALAANRDEYFARSTAAAAWWEHEGTRIFGGRDLDKGGSWLGLSIKPSGVRVAAVTNVRDPSARNLGVHSRGWLVRDALTQVEMPPVVGGEGYPAYNLIVGDARELFYLRDDAFPVRIQEGFHGLSNHRLDTAWPKVEDAVHALEQTSLEDVEGLFRILTNDAVKVDGRLPNSGVPLDVERALSPAFIRMGHVGYGTRSSTVVIGRSDGAVDFEERTWSASGTLVGSVRERIFPHPAR